MSEAPYGATNSAARFRGGGLRNRTGSISILILAFAPQLAVLTYCFARAFFSLFAFLPGMEAIVGRFSIALGVSMVGAALANQSLLAFYSLPLVIVAVGTLFTTVKAERDYYGGIALIAVALFAFWASNDLAGMRGFSFGPGTAPRLFSGMLLLLGIAIALIGIFNDGERISGFAFRGPFFVTVSVLLFSVAIRPLGLIVSGIITFLIAAMGSHETRWVEAIIVGVLLTLFCAFLFPYVLGLPFQLLPLFMQ